MSAVKQVGGEGVPALLWAEAKTWLCEHLSEHVGARPSPRILRGMTAFAEPVPEPSPPFPHGWEALFYSELYMPSTVWLIINS